MKIDAMAEDHFWKLIAQTTRYEADPDRQIEELHHILSELSADEIVAFELAFEREQKRSYSWDLWGAAFVINGGASDDGFEYFQRWLISKGRKVFETALSDPDNLADLLEPGSGEYEFEEFAYVACSVWTEKTGKPRASFPYTGAPPAAQPFGTPFKEDPSYLAKRYPKLWTKFGH